MSLRILVFLWVAAAITATLDVAGDDRSQTRKSAMASGVPMPTDTLNIAEVLDEKGALKYRYSRYMSEDGKRWVRHGLFVAYYPNGRVASEVTYSHGKEEGASKDFHPNGVVASEGQYQAGQEVGVWKYYKEDGSLESTEAK